MNGLINKGVEGHLHHTDDLFKLPDCINVVHLAQQMRAAIHATPTLLRSLHQAHGFEFYSIGVLRLISDLSGFAGPLLLGGLLSHTTDKGVGKDDVDLAPYWYAVGLFGMTALGKHNHGTTM